MRLTRANVEGHMVALSAALWDRALFPLQHKRPTAFLIMISSHQEFRLNNDASNRFHWPAGVFYFDEHLEVDSFNYSDRTDVFDGYAFQVQDATSCAFRPVRL